MNYYDEAQGRNLHGTRSNHALSLPLRWRQAPGDLAPEPFQQISAIDRSNLSWVILLPRTIRIQGARKLLPSLFRGEDVSRCILPRWNRSSVEPHYENNTASRTQQSSRCCWEKVVSRRGNLLAKRWKLVSRRGNLLAEKRTDLCSESSPCRRQVGPARLTPRHGRFTADWLGWDVLRNVRRLLSVLAYEKSRSIVTQHSIPSVPGTHPCWNSPCLPAAHLLI
jgi:hypothetical protein